MRLACSMPVASRPVTANATLSIVQQLLSRAAELLNDESVVCFGAQLLPLGEHTTGCESRSSDFRVARRPHTMATKKPPVTRLRDLEEDVFDVAHNNLLRTATELPITGRRLMVNATDWEAKPEEAGQSAEGTKVLMCADTTADTNGEQLTQVQAAVQATWAKANALQEQAVSSAVKAAVREAKADAAREKEVELRTQEEELRADFEKANRRLWEIAARDQEVAIQKAIADEAAEVKSLKAELVQQQKKAAEELEEAYRSLKGEATRVVEDQHAHNVNTAVQAAWEAAGRIEAAAVAAARKETKAEIEGECEKRMAAERLERDEKMRKSIAEAVQASADEMQSNKEEVQRLRQEVERLQEELKSERKAARDAEAKAAEKQKMAVAQAVKMVEEVAAKRIARAERKKSEEEVAAVS